MFLLYNYSLRHFYLSKCVLCVMILKNVLAEFKIKTLQRRTKRNHPVYIFLDKLEDYFVLSRCAFAYNTLNNLRQWSYVPLMQTTNKLLMHK